MNKKNIKSLKQFTKIGAPVERSVKWSVEVTNDNLEFLKPQFDTQISIGEKVELEGQVFIKKLAFNDLHEISKAYEWDIDNENVENSKLKSINIKAMQAGHLLGSVCEDEKGTPFFESVSDVLNSEIPFIEALYSVADEVNNFMGKSLKKSLKSTNSGVNLSSTELVEKPLKKPRTKSVSKS